MSGFWVRDGAALDRAPALLGRVPPAGGKKAGRRLYCAVMRQLHSSPSPGAWESWLQPGRRKVAASQTYCSVKSRLGSSARADRRLFERYWCSQEPEGEEDPNVCPLSHFIHVVPPFLLVLLQCMPACLWGLRRRAFEFALRPSNSRLAANCCLLFVWRITVDPDVYALHVRVSKARLGRPCARTRRFFFPSRYSWLASFMSVRTDNRGLISRASLFPVVRIVSCLVIRLVRPVHAIRCAVLLCRRRYCLS